MGMADPRDYGGYPDKLEENKTYAMSCFNSLQFAVDRDLRRNRFNCEVIVSAGYENAGLVTAVRVKPFKVAMPLFRAEDRDTVISLQEQDLIDIGRELTKSKIPIEDNLEKSMRIADLKSHIKFLENILYGTLKVNPQMVEGLRKLRE